MVVEEKIKSQILIFFIIVTMSSDLSGLRGDVYINPVRSVFAYFISQRSFLKNK